MVTRQSIVKLINDEERNFPKPFPLLKSEKREKNIWSKAEVKAWLEEQRSQKVT
jgi:predicted DNA-binding transcriptional regulator AlpA